MARLSGGERPFPPGDYPLVVVGSGPGGLQTSYCLTRLGVEHALLSRDEHPGGMFRHFPIFERLLSWTKPDAPFPREAREYEWYDHNSLIADDAADRAVVAGLMDRSFFVPSRPDMEGGLALFAERTGVRARYGCRWEATRREEDGSFVLETSDGEYRCRAAVFALGVTEPWKSDTPGIEHVPHYVDTRPAREYAGKTVFVIGKRNSAFEVADALLPWARRVVLASPRPVETGVLALSTVRARYLQPLEDAELGGGTLVLDAAIERIERIGERFRILAHGTTREGEVEVEADEVIAATGFRTPLLDLPDLGVATVSQGRIPAQTPFWESATVPGLYFAGNATQGSPGLRRHGVASSSGAVHGFRYNARLLARHLAATRFGMESDGRPLPREKVVPFLLGELARGPELWAQKGYLARVVSFGENGALDEGIQPLMHFVDAGGLDAVAVAVEMNAAGEIYPTVYVRRRGEVAAEELAGELFHDFESQEHKRKLEALLTQLGTAARP